MTSFEVKLNFGVRDISFYQVCDGLQATVYSYDGINDNEPDEVFQSEPIYFQTRFDFTQTFSTNFRFEKLQRYLVKLSALNSTINQTMGSYGEAEFDLSLVFSSGGKFSIPISNTLYQNSRTPTLEINAIVPDYYSQFLRLQFFGHNIMPLDGLTQAFYFTLSISKGHQTILLHKSELVKDTKNPLWAQFSIPLFILNIYHESSIRFYCYNYIGNHPDQAIGYCSTTLTQLQRGAGALNSYMLLDNTGKRINEKTSIELTHLELEKGPTFFEMLKNGTTINLSEALDFTASNGNPVQEDSLHHIHPHRMSPYVKTILDVTPPLMGYLPSKSSNNSLPIGALGFGANISNSTGTASQLSHCFFLNGSTTNHQVNGLQELLNCYRQAILSVQPFAPTDFSEVIYFISKFAKAESRLKLGLYFVLVIMSDGGPANASTMKRSIDALVDASVHPMSVLAIGIGEDRDFTPMRNLEALTLKHSDGRLLARQNYTFVEASELADSDVLSMIPLQMIQWKKQFN